MHNDDMYASWPLTFVRGAGPRYRQIADFIEGAVAANRMQPGDRLPPQRRLAQHLDVDLTTVTRAYAEAAQRGLIEARGPLGTFIARPVEQPLRQMLDLGMNMPPLPLGCDLQDLLRRGLAQAMERHDVGVMMTYHQAGGGPAEREAGAQWLAQSVERVDPDRVLVCPGAQAALAAVMLAYSRPGDGIIAEPLVYPGLLTAAQQLGRRVLVAETDADGMTPAGLERACRDGGRLVYLNPTLQNPTAHTMSAARRRDLVRAAAARGVRIIEDDPYSLFLDDAPPALASLAPASVFYIATLAKTLTPGLRTAFVLSPDEDGRRNVLAAMRAFAVMAAPLMGGAYHAMDRQRHGAADPGRCARRGPCAPAIGAPVAAGAISGRGGRHPPVAAVAQPLDRGRPGTGGARRRPERDLVGRLPPGAGRAQRHPHLAGQHSRARGPGAGAGAAGRPGAAASARPARRDRLTRKP